MSDSVIEARDSLTVEGPDAAKYLQGQLSNDVVKLGVGASCWSLLLEPSGKLGFVVRVRRTGDESFVIDADQGNGPAIETRLRRFLIRTKANITSATLLVDVAASSTAPDGSLVGWWGSGEHSIVDGGAPDIDGVTAAKVRAGWPTMVEASQGVIPGELGIVSVAASFTKGCYTGQELVARVDSRGNNVPRLLHRVRGEGVAVGVEIVSEGRTVGVVTSAAGDCGLAFIARGVDPASPLTAAGLPADADPGRAA